jgi:hypothetical protein
MVLAPEDIEEVPAASARADNRHNSRNKPAAYSAAKDNSTVNGSPVVAVAVKAAGYRTTENNAAVNNCAMTTVEAGSYIAAENQTAIYSWDKTVDDLKRRSLEGVPLKCIVAAGHLSP